MASKELKIFSIGIPAISSGIYGFPKDKCAEIILSSAITWASNQDPDQPLRLIKIVNFDQPTVEIFQKIFIKVLADYESESDNEAGENDGEKKN